MKKHHIPAVFSESTVSDKPARQVARETGAHYGGVLYVDNTFLHDYSFIPSRMPCTSVRVVTFSRSI